MVIYTLLGLVVALFQSTAATDAIGTHWIPNLIFALLFLVFAVSFLGAFEITLPSGLANKADRESTGWPSGPSSAWPSSDWDSPCPSSSSPSSPE